MATIVDDNEFNEASAACTSLFVAAASAVSVMMLNHRNKTWVKLYIKARQSWSIQYPVVGVRYTRWFQYIWMDIAIFEEIYAQVEISKENTRTETIVPSRCVHLVTSISPSV